VTRFSIAYLTLNLILFADKKVLLLSLSSIFLNFIQFPSSLLSPTEATNEIDILKKNKITPEEFIGIVNEIYRQNP